MNNECIEAIKSRRSIRKFDSRPVPNEKLELLIEAARLAPSSTNRQPCRFALLQEPRWKEKLKDAVPQPFVLQAPALFVCCLDRRAYTRGHVEKRMTELVQAEAITAEGASYITGLKMPESAAEVVIPAAAYIDLGIAVQNMVIQAASLGLGSCWVRLFDRARFHEALQLAPEIEAVALLPVGYPAESPPPRPRLGSSEILIEPGA